MHELKNTPIRFSLRSFIIGCISVSFCLTLFIQAALAEGGLFFAPYHLLGESVLMGLIIPCLLLAPIFAICLIVWLVSCPESPITVRICFALVAFGVMHLLGMGFCQEFYFLVQVLAPTSFIFAMVGFGEIAIRKNGEHIPTTCYAIGLSLTYWIFTVGLTAVVG